MLKAIKQCRVLVTPNSFKRSDPQIIRIFEESVAEVLYNTTGKPLSSAQVADLLPGIDGYIAGVDHIDRDALASADSLKIIVRYGVGIDRVDLAAAAEKGIIVSNTPGANSSSVAELALGLILALARQIPQASAAMRHSQWPRLLGLTLEEKTIGIIGLGAIGKQLVKRLTNFDCHVMAYDPYPDREFAQKYTVDFVSLDDLVARADFISLHLPVLPKTTGMVDKDFIRGMKPGSFLINTARGELIVEDALIEGLNSGHLGGAALDAFSQEPPDPDDPLLAMPHVICTPHLGAQTDGAINAMGRMAIEECLRVLNGERPLYQVN